MAAHRYWRVNCQTTAGAVFALAELSLRIVAGGASVATGGTAYASSIYAGFTTAAAFDGNVNTNWAAATGTAGEYIAYDLGAGVTKDIAEFAITARNDNNPGQAPLTGRLEYSDDNTTWVSAVSFTAASWTTLGQVQVFAVPPASAHRYWRTLAATTFATGYLGCATLALKDTAGGTDRAAGAVDTAGGKQALTGTNLGGAYSAAKAFDGNAATFTTSGGVVAAGGNWVGVDFGAGVTWNIVQVDFQVRPDSFREDPSTLSIQFSDDGTTWTEKWSVPSIPAWAAGELRTYSFAAPGFDQVYEFATEALSPGVASAQVLEFAVETLNPGTAAVQAMTIAATALSPGVASVQTTNIAVQVLRSVTLSVARRRRQFVTG